MKLSVDELLEREYLPEGAGDEQTPAETGGLQHPCSLPQNLEAAIMQAMQQHGVR